jgi:hypothetical protein
MLFGRCWFVAKRSHKGLLFLQEIDDPNSIDRPRALHVSVCLHGCQGSVDVY